MLKSKQRAYLRGLANNVEPCTQIGKAGVSPEFVKNADEALEARELIKVSVLENFEGDIKDAAQTVAERTRSEVVQVIGRRFSLYRRAKLKPAIELPK